MVEKRDSFHTLTVLIADAQLANRQVLRAMLVQFGVRTVLECSTHDDVLSAFQGQPVDIVFAGLDFGGRGQGFTLLRQLRDRQYSRDPYVPVVIMGQQVASQAVTSARDHGAHEFLVIPVTTETVLRKLQSITLRPRPFVQAPTYFGPERRRQRGAPPQGAERRWDTSGPAGGSPPSGPAQ